MPAVRSGGGQAAAGCGLQNGNSCTDICRKDVIVRWSKTFIPTMKEIPSDAEIPSHQLMLRAGLIRQLMAGAYTYLPLGWRAIRKAEQNVREELAAASAVALFLPAQQPI